MRVENFGMMREHLGGKVTVERLVQRFDGQPFRAVDERGEVVWPSLGTEYQYLHLMEMLQPGQRRGFHRHTNSAETIYIFRGEMRLLLADGGRRDSMRLEAGDLARISPGVDHGLVALTPVAAVCMNAGSNPIEDAERVELPEEGT